MNSGLNSALTSNGFVLSCDLDRLGYLNPISAHAPHEVLKQSFENQGYLWIKGLISPLMIQPVQRMFFQLCQEQESLKPGSDPIDGIFSGIPIPLPVLNQIRLQCLRSDEFQAIIQSSEILDFLRILLEGEAQATKRRLIRSKFPNAGDDTGAHYDGSIPLLQ